MLKCDKLPNGPYKTQYIRSYHKNIDEISKNNSDSDGNINKRLRDIITYGCNMGALQNPKLRKKLYTKHIKDKTDVKSLKVLLYLVYSYYRLKALYHRVSK